MTRGTYFWFWSYRFSKPYPDWPSRHFIRPLSMFGDHCLTSKNLKIQVTKNWPYSIQIYYRYKLLGSRFESWNSIDSFALIYSIHFEGKTTRKRKRKRKGNSISLVPTTAALPQISQKKVIRRRCSLVRRQHSVSFSEFHSVFQLILDMA